MSTGCWPVTIGSVATSACSPSTASCSCAAGRLTSSDAIRTFLAPLSLRRRAILAVLVVLPEPWRPTIITTAGGVTSSLRSDASEPSISVSASLTILTTCWPGVIDFSTDWPTASSVTLSTNSRTTGSATSASSSAIRTSRIAARTSASLSAPRPRRRSKTPPSLSLKLSNMRPNSFFQRSRPAQRTKRRRAKLAGRRAPNPVGVRWSHHVRRGTIPAPLAELFYKGKPTCATFTASTRFPAKTGFAE